MHNDSMAIKCRDAHKGPVSRMVSYLMHEGSGAAMADSLGNAPNFAISTGTPLATNVGWFTPPASNSTVYAQLTQALDTAGYMQELFDFSQPYSNILIGLDYVQGIDIGTAHTLFSLGKNGTTTTGLLAVQINATELFTVFYRGCNCTANQSLSLGTDLTGLARAQLLIDIARTGNTTFTVSGYVNGVLGGSANGDWLNASGTAALGSGTGTNRFGDGFLLGATVGASIGGAKSAYMNQAVSENSRIGRFFAARLETTYAGIGQAVALDLYRRRGEFPASLIGK